ncbi:unnamed protein product (macronuclear) [Paramecium tetraurelia]|uniref:Uncharacterized protein n=1 Tax=Paramecium tetraurelia TaxID=5888 RepID=A0DYD6_PARTE|nr:uncharacterized protein GSPATT00003021001 [Paramecium tetraurelia]CAK88053.1 unnamed protein product [Paramecium tetraurelia]|eukprot:XP_001455450.1 hypothetical protein (macronuclear) [Paramecium tetraurelia strain d4-2]
MGNECKQCTTDVQSVGFQSQHNVITQSHQYSFGMNCIDHDLNFEYSSLDVPTVPQFGFEQQKIKADLFPPQALRVASEDSNMSFFDLEETVEQQINSPNNCAIQLQKNSSQEENSIVQYTTKMKQTAGSNLATSLEVHIQQQQTSQRSIQKQRQLFWDSRTVNKELQQNKKANQTFISQLEYFDQLCSSRKEKTMVYIPLELNKNRDNKKQMKQSEKNLNLNQKIQDEFLQQKINEHYNIQQSKFPNCE